MGLDISAYSNIEILSVGPYRPELEEDWDSDDGIRQDFINPHFPHAVFPFPVVEDEQNYVHWKQTGTTEYHGFRAGSYSGYGLWRSTLAGTFLGTTDLYMDHRNNSDEPDWEKVYASEGKPFYELINFSDCEGVFFGPVCTKLYNDFVDNREVYIESENPYPAWDNDYFVSRYDDWMEAFRLGSQNGLVSLH